MKSILVALVLLVLSPVLVHATARAAFVRERVNLGLLQPKPEDGPPA